MLRETQGSGDKVLGKNMNKTYLIKFSKIYLNNFKETSQNISQR